MAQRSPTCFHQSLGATEEAARQDPCPNSTPAFQEDRLFRNCRVLLFVGVFLFAAGLAVLSSFHTRRSGANWIPGFFAAPRCHRLSRKK